MTAMRRWSYSLVIGIGFLLGQPLRAEENVHVRIVEPDSSEADSPTTQPASQPVTVSPDLLSSGPPTAEVVARLVQEFGNREPTIREAAVRRLAGYPNESAAAVVEAFARDRLAVRLAARELLTLWKAPVGELDPWRPETFDDERLKALKEWATTPGKQPASRPAEWTGDELKHVARELDALVRARSETEAQAIRERLACAGAALLPEVYARLKTVEDDQARERLTALRYRLTASDALALRWSSGFDRLASVNADTRRRAADELGGLASAADAAMLLELFSSPDALVREVSLRLLSKLGGVRATDAMVRLLDDPDANLRAAVLKQWTEKPAPAAVPKIATYAARETDPDLIVHAVRAMRAAGFGAVAPKSALDGFDAWDGAIRTAKTVEAADCLMGLVGNPTWQVRAETADALGEYVNKYLGVTDEQRQSAFLALIGLLGDSEGFVVSRAVAGLQKTKLEAAIEPLVRAADAHPEFAADIVSILAGSAELRPKSITHLRSFCTHPNAVVRAAAIAGLGTAACESIEQEIMVTLADPESMVRTAAADALFQIMEAARTANGRITASNAAETQPEDAPPSATQTEDRSLVTTRPAGADTWMARWHSGRNRPPWMVETIPLLEQMLAASWINERVAACRPLAALGREETALPVLLAGVDASEPDYPRIVSVLPWLPDEKLSAFLDQLRRLKSGDEALNALVRAIARVPGNGATESLWALLAIPTTDLDLGGEVFTALVRAYSGDDNYDPPGMSTSQRRLMNAIAKAKAASGPPMQRLIALALLLGTSPDDAAEAAIRLFRDESVPASLREGAFQILLLSRPTETGNELAVAALTHPLGEVRRMALAYLSRHAKAMLYLDKQIWLYRAAREELTDLMYGLGGSKASLQPPKHVRPDALRPLLADSDPQSAAYAGYLLSLFGEREGIAPLVAFWRANAMSDDTWTRLVYRAAAAINSEEQTSLLEEVYDRYRNDAAFVREFYATLRAATGSWTQKLRQKIEADVGVDRLK